MTGPCLVQLWFPVYNTVAGSLSQAAVLLGCLVTASASGRVPKAVHFLNSGRKQSGRAGAAGQQGSPEETCSPAAGGRGVCQGEEGGRRLASPHPGVLTAPSIAEVSPSLCHPSCGEAPLWESYWGKNQALFFFGPGSRFVVGPSTTTRFGVGGCAGWV